MNFCAKNPKIGLTLLTIFGAKIQLKNFWSKNGKKIHETIFEIFKYCDLSRLTYWYIWRKKCSICNIFNCHVNFITMGKSSSVIDKYVFENTKAGKNCIFAFCPYMEDTESVVDIRRNGFPLNFLE